MGEEQTAESSAGSDDQGSLFISYSRRDKTFVQALHQALEERGRETWVDWHDIPPSDNWLDRIHAAIEQAEAVVFILSPDSVASDVCEVELQHAVAQQKRLIPLLHRELDAPPVKALAELNWIYVREEDSLATACDQLLEAVDTDLGWVRDHTRLLVRALEWQRQAQHPSFTLRGRDLDRFEAWAVEAADKQQKPTALQTAFLLASRRAVTRRQFTLWASLTAGLCITLGLGTVAWLQMNERDRQADIAGARQMLSRAEALRDAPVETGAEGGALRLAVAALDILHRRGAPTLEADQSLRKSFADAGRWQPLSLGRVKVRASALDAQGQMLAVYTSQAELIAIDLTAWDTVARCSTGDNLTEQEGWLALSGDGRRLALLTTGGVAGAPWTRLSVWSLPDCQRVYNSEEVGLTSGAAGNIGLNLKGNLLLKQTRQGLHTLDLVTGAKTPLSGTDSVYTFVVSPSGAQVATYEKGTEKRSRWLRVRDFQSGEMLWQGRLPSTARNLSWGSAGVMIQSQGFRLYGEDGKLAWKRTLQATQLALSADGKQFAAASQDGRIEVRDASGNDLFGRGWSGRTVNNLSFVAEGSAVVVVDASEQPVNRWLLNPGGAYAALETPAVVATVRFSEDSRELLATTATGLYSWHMPLPGAAFEIPDMSSQGPAPQPDPMHEARASVKGSEQLLSMVSDGRGGRALLIGEKSTRGGYQRRLEIWSGEVLMASQQMDLVLDTSHQALLQFAGQGRYLVVGQRNGLAVLESRSLASVATLYHAGAVVAGMQVDGRRAVTLGRDHSVRVWDVASGTEISRIQLRGGAKALALSNDGRWLALRGTDDKVELWAIGADNLIAQACHGLSGNCPDAALNMRSASRSRE